MYLDNQQRLGEFGLYLGDTWGWVWPEMILPIFAVAILLGWWMAALRVKRLGTAAFKGQGGFWNFAIKRAAGLVATGLFGLIILVSVQYFGQERVAKHHDLWAWQIKEFIPMLKGVAVGEDSTVVALEAEKYYVVGDDEEIPEGYSRESWEKFINRPVGAIEGTLGRHTQPRTFGKERVYRGGHPRWWVDPISLFILLLLLTQVLGKSGKIWLFGRYIWGVVVVLYLILYLTLRPWLQGQVDFWSLTLVINLLQLCVVALVLPLACRKLVWMLKNRQCVVTIDPIEKQPMAYTGQMFFGLGIGTFIAFTSIFFVLLLFPADIIKLGGSIRTRLIYLVLQVLATGAFFFLTQLERVKQKIMIEIPRRVSLIAGGILSILAFALPGVWLFLFLLILMILVYELGANYQVPIAHKLVIEIFKKDRYDPWIFLWQKETNRMASTYGCLKTMLREGLHITLVAMWAPWLRVFVFVEEILEVNKYKVDEPLATSSVPCKFETDDQGRLIEILTDGEGVSTGPPVEFFVSQRFGMYHDPRLFLRLSLEDRRDPTGLLKRDTQNHLARLTRKLGMNQALIGSYYTSEAHFFFFDGPGTEPMTFPQLLRRGSMRVVGFLEMSTELSDGNPPPGLEASQIELEKAKIDLETERLRAEMAVIKKKAEGTGAKEMIEEIEKALQKGASALAASEWLQVMELVKSDAVKWLLPSGLIDRLGGLGDVARRLGVSAPTTPAAPTSPPAPPAGD